jgi:hypothetical protein
MPRVSNVTSDSDDLIEQLQENLRLRRQLGAEVAKARKSSLSGASLIGWFFILLVITGICFWVFHHLILAGAAQQ